MRKTAETVPVFLGLSDTERSALPAVTQRFLKACLDVHDTLPWGRLNAWDQMRAHGARDTGTVILAIAHDRMRPDLARALAQERRCERIKRLARIRAAGDIIDEGAVITAIVEDTGPFLRALHARLLGGWLRELRTMDEKQIVQATTSFACRHVPEPADIGAKLETTIADMATPRPVDGNGHCGSSMRPLFK